MDLAEAPQRVLELASPSRDALLDWLLPHVSRLMIEEISSNDRGEDVARYLDSIARRMDARPAVRPRAFGAREVLELERWSEPEKHSVSSPPSGSRGHLKRLLACTLLLQDAAEPETDSGIGDRDFVESSASTLIQLTRSAIALREGVPVLALGFLLWVWTSQPAPSFSPFASFCIVLLSVRLGLGQLADSDLAELFDWAEQEEARCRDALQHDAQSERWLTGLNIYQGGREDRNRLLDCGKQVIAAPMLRYPQTKTRLDELLGRIAR